MKTPELIEVEAATHSLGFGRDRLAAEALAALDRFFGGEDWQSRLAPARAVALPAFAIAKTTLPFADLLGDPYDLPDEVQTLAQVCDRIDVALAAHGLRLPTENELEAAAGGALFFWGDELPAGPAYGSAFPALKGPTPRGLVIDPDPYQVEVARTAMMLGDGGDAACGGYPWPVGWLCLSPSWRLRDEDVGDVLLEFLEGCHIRPVRA